MDNKVVGIGYNGFPIHVSDDDQEMTWGKDSDDPSKVKYPYGENKVLTMAASASKGIRGSMQHLHNIIIMTTCIF